MAAPEPIDATRGCAKLATMIGLRWASCLLLLAALLIGQSQGDCRVAASSAAGAGCCQVLAAAAPCCPDEPSPDCFIAACQQADDALIAMSAKPLASLRVLAVLVQDRDGDPPARARLGTTQARPPPDPLRRLVDCVVLRG